MVERTDRRIIRTQLLLRKTLLALMEEKRVERITVRELSERANINRGTFYLHYRDVTDLFDRMKEEILNELIEFMKNIKLVDIKTYAERGEPYPVSVQVFEYLKSQEGFFRVIFSPNGDLSFPLQIQAYIKNLLYRQLYNFQSQTEKDSFPLDYLVAYITSAHIGLIMHWFQTGRRLSVEEVANIITRILHYGPLAVTKVNI